MLPVSTGLCRQGLGQRVETLAESGCRSASRRACVDPQQVHGRLADSRSSALHYPVPRQPSSCTLLQHLLGSHFPMPCLCILGNFVAALVPPLVGSLGCRLVVDSSVSPVWVRVASSPPCCHTPLSGFLRISGFGAQTAAPNPGSEIGS